MGAEDMALLFTPRTIDVEALGLYNPAIFNGEKFPGGFGATQILWKDYWDLRARSVQMFEKNLYARGIIRRLITNVINTGLDLEASPEEVILGKEEGSMDEWSEEVENRWRVWARSPGQCDAQRLRGFGRVQCQAWMEALLGGDVLVVLMQDRATGLPRVKLIDGQSVQTPVILPRPGHRIEEGVELDAMGRQVAYWVVDSNGEHSRLPAWGEKSGRRLAWLVYGTEKRDHETRGTPILALVLQSINEIDRYRDSVQRKATINAMLAMFIQKDEERMGTRPIAGAAVRRSVMQTVSQDDSVRTLNASSHIPGFVFDELNVGEKPIGFGNNGTDEKFGEFEEAIVQGMAWHLEVPPEIMRLAFSSNYSASQAAINEFKMTLNRIRTDFGEQFCKPVYQEWLVAQALTGRIKDVGELLAARRDPAMYDIFGAWLFSEWAGHIKPSTDLVKQAKGYEILIDMGAITRDLMSKEITGTKYSKNVKRLKKENAQLAEAREELAAPEREAQHQQAIDLVKAKPEEPKKEGGLKNVAT